MGIVNKLHQLTCDIAHGINIEYLQKETKTKPSYWMRSQTISSKKLECYHR